MAEESGRRPPPEKERHGELDPSFGDIRDLAGGALVTFVGKVGRLSRAAFLAVIALFCGLEVVGAYSVAWGFVATVNRVARFGLQRGVVRFLTAGGVRSRWKSPPAAIDAALAASLLIGALASAAVVAGLLLATEQVAAFYDKPGQLPLEEPLRILAWSAPFVTAAWIFLSATRALRIMRYAVYVFSVAGPLLLLAGSVAIAMLGGGTGWENLSQQHAAQSGFAVAVAWVQLGSAAACGFLAARYFGRHFSLRRSLTRLRTAPVAAMARFSAPVMLADVMVAVLTQLDVLMLGKLVTLTEVGIYSVARRVASSMLKAVQAFDPVFSSVVSELSHLRREEEVARRFVVISRWLLTVNLPIFATLFIVGDSLSGLGRRKMGRRAVAAGPRPEDPLRPRHRDAAPGHVRPHRAAAGHDRPARPQHLQQQSLAARQLRPQSLAHKRIRGDRGGLRSDPVDVLRQFPAGAAGLAPSPHPPLRPQPDEAARRGRGGSRGSLARSRGHCPRIGRRARAGGRHLHLRLRADAVEARPRARRQAAPAARLPRPAHETGSPPELPVTTRAIVLAAGAGTRLNPMTNGLPKCLVRFGERRLVDLQIAALQAAGVEDIVLVVGFEADQVRRHFRGLPDIRFVENPDFGSTNSIYSLYLARSLLDRETFLFNCDIVFHPALLERMLGGDGPNAIAVDSQVPRLTGEMNVRIRESGAVAAIGKNLDPSGCQAQSVQLARFDYGRGPFRGRRGRTPGRRSAQGRVPDLGVRPPDRARRAVRGGGWGPSLGGDRLGRRLPRRGRLGAAAVVTRTAGFR